MDAPRDDGTGVPISAARRLRIAHIKGDYRRIGGPEQLLRKFLPVMAAGECEPVLVALQSDPKRRFTEELLGDAAVEAHVMPWRGLAVAPLVGMRLARWLDRSRIDLVHSHDMRANLAMSFSQLLVRKPWISHVHGWLGPTHSGRYRLYEAIDRRLIRRADRVLVGSHATLAEVQSEGVGRASVVPNAVAMPPAAGPGGSDRQKSELRLPTDALIVAIFGRLHPGKGQDLLIEAIAGLPDNPFHLVIVGEGESRAEIEARIADLGLASRVTVTGFVDSTEPYFAVADIVVVPSRKESLPLTVLEAMAHAKPVIVTAVGDLARVVRDGVDGLVVPPEDAPALSFALARLLSDADLRTKLGRSGRERAARHHSIEAYVRTLEKLYHEELDQ